MIVARFFRLIRFIHTRKHSLSRLFWDFKLNGSTGIEYDSVRGFVHSAGYIGGKAGECSDDMECSLVGFAFRQVHESSKIRFEG